ncbi:Myb-like protein L [Ananas comosus]|uniref:Myb-like protein L n=1 Tax=Ananas comosus TaxID=4615 RepID=A0A199V3Y9_ANACO|nr:Myb-like protein L [Ananas comosus]
MASYASSDSDRDDALDEDMEALRRACMLTGADPPDALGGSDSDSGGESSDSDDLGLLRRLQERFSVPSAAAGASESLPFVKPLSILPQSDSDEEDDFETLRAIQRRFSHYESVAVLDALQRTSESFVQEADDLGLMSKQGTPDIFPKDGKRSVLSEEYSGSAAKVSHHGENKSLNFNARTLTHSQFPKSAQALVDALKKNRSCQKFIRRKLIEIEAKIEENKKLKDRVKCLMDFQVACKKTAGHILCQKKDPRVRLISNQKPSSRQPQKNTCRKLPVLYYGPEENSQVSKYKLVQERFPVSLRKQPWSNTEREKLAKGIKQQYQEMLMCNLMNADSNIEGLHGSDMMPALCSSDLEVPPEKIRSFLPSVNWDRLATLYLPDRSGEECEERWLNCEDPLINHNPWTMMEDKKLLFIVQERGVYNWINISISLGTHRTPFQCLARYQRSLNPHILNRDWTEEEDITLCAAVETFGDNNWQAVASHMDSRTGPQCSNRWRKTLNPDRRKVGRWSVDEDKRLKVAVMLFGAKNWNKIAQFAPGRTQVQCRERWLNCLDPSLNLQAWTAEEDSKLLEAINEHVPLLQAARQMKRTVLISNFVDRESERPTIGPNDFTTVISSKSGETVEKTSSDQTKKMRTKSKRCRKENSAADGLMESSAGTAEDVRVERSTKRSSSGSRQRKSRDKSRKTDEENLTTDGIANPSGDNVPANMPGLHGVNSCTAEKMGIKRKRGTSSSNSRKKSRNESGKSPGDNFTPRSMLNTSANVDSSGLLLYSNGNSHTDENGNTTGVECQH